MREKFVPEKRLIDRMTGYWERLKGDNELPPFQKFNNSAIADIWSHCFVVDVDERGGVKNYVYEYVGESIVNAYGKNPAGDRMSSKMHDVPGGTIVTKIDNCVDGKQIVVEQGQFINQKSKIVKYRSCMLPFGKANGTVTHIVTGLSWREF